MAKLFTKAYRLGATEADGGAGGAFVWLVGDFDLMSLGSLGCGFGVAEARNRIDAVKNRDWAEERSGRIVRGVKGALGHDKRRKPLAKLAMVERRQ